MQPIWSFIPVSILLENITYQKYIPTYTKMQNCHNSNHLQKLTENWA
jgi:hypothetical protein